jgi:hypothetical protein
MITFIIGAVLGFVGGVLVGRRNAKKVEAALAQANALIAQIEAKVK